MESSNVPLKPVDIETAAKVVERLTQSSVRISVVILTIIQWRTLSIHLTLSLI
jgi:hypothetical protein